MNYYSMLDNAVLNELGNRIKRQRLSRNITQEALAEATLLSVGTIKSLEVGKAKLATVVAVLREFGALQELDSFIPEITISPLEIAKRKTPKRVRAGRRQSISSDQAKDTESEW